MGGVKRFYHQANNSGYNGLAKHDAGVNDLSNVEVLEVASKALDEVVPDNRAIRLIKIDVEGGEINVIRGGLNVLRRNMPTMIFEATQSGLASNRVNVGELYEVVRSIGYQIRTPRSDLEDAAPLDAVQFERAMAYPFAAFSFVARPAQK